jgi:hypothetical protein
VSINVRLIVAAGALCVAVTSSAYSQEAAGAPAGQNGASGLDAHGSFDVGYRFLDVNGSSDTFRQYFDLSEGPRLLGVDVHGAAPNGSGAFADRYALTASGLGGDPFPTVQLTVSKSRLYDLRVNWRQSRFFDGPPDTTASTTAHSWSSARQIGNIALTFDATNRLHVLFNYDRVSNGGSIQTTRTLDYVGSSDVWGAFARANPYALFGPVNNTADRVTGGVTYGGDRWTVNYRAGYEVFDETQTLDPLTGSERSLNVGDQTTAPELLSTLGWSQARHMTAPTSDLSIVVRPVSNVEWRASYLFYRYRGPFSLDASYQGTARTNTGGTLFSPYSIGVSTRGTASAPSQVMGQGVTWRPLAHWAFDADYRYLRSASDAEAQFGSTVALYPVPGAPPTLTSQITHTAWVSLVDSLDLSATWAPVAALTIRPGVRLSRRDVEMREDDVIRPEVSNHEGLFWPEIEVGYHPVSQFSARGAYETTYSDDPFTRMSPDQRSTGRLTIHAEPAPALTIEASATKTDAELADASFTQTLRTGSLAVAYAVNQRFSITGGLDYQSFLGTGSVTFLRGTPPITDVAMRDREVDRVWQGGVIVHPVSRFGVTASANFDRTSGLDTIAGEAPLYGPLSFTYATGSAYYEFPRVGRVTLDLQRTYLLQELLPLTNFRANLVTVRFSRAF